MHDKEIVDLQSEIILGKKPNELGYLLWKKCKDRECCSICDVYFESSNIYGSLVKYSCGHEICYSCFVDNPNENFTGQNCPICLKYSGYGLLVEFTPQVTIFKIENISWETTVEDIRKYFAGFEISKYGIHIPIDRQSGKTRNYGFVECVDLNSERKPTDGMNGVYLKNRTVDIHPSSLLEMTAAHFEDEKLLKRDDINAIVSICRNYKLHFSRKCAERPFQH